MVRIRPFVQVVKKQMGCPHALLSDRLLTDGATVMYNFVEDEAERADGRIGLARLRNKQLVFRDAVEQYFESVAYEDGFATSFMPTRFGDGVVQVNCRINAGQPSFVRGGIRVDDVSRRVRASEPLREVAD